MEGSAGYSLTGYLSLKPCGALSLVLPVRRYWCAFNELTQTLEFYQTERDLIHQKSPIESIQLHRSAITLNPTEDRTFTILTNTKEYHLRAENHEALMIWLLGLQSKRDSWISMKSELIINETESGFDLDEIINNEEIFENHKFTISRNSRTNSLSKTEFIDRNHLLDCSNDEDKLRTNSIFEYTRRTMSLSSNANPHLCDHCMLSLCQNCRTTGPQSTHSFANRNGSSSHSIESTDSAFSDQSSLSETLLTLKCELASLINKESTYQMIIKEKTETIKKFEKQLADILRTDNSSSKNQVISKVFNERTRQANNELKFLHCEINKLHRMIRDDDLKIRKLFRMIRFQQTQRESLQRDYIFLLQTALSNEEGRLFGGVKHRERLKDLLNECRKRDPSLPSYDSLEGSGIYIDTYGFKHEKNNENDRLQYICVKLSQFYDSKCHHIDENFWRTLLKTYQSTSIVSKSFKTLIRQGVPHHLRSEVWHIFIHKQIEHIRKEKGFSYYENLCHLLPNSDLSSKFEKQIALDLYRTMPMNIRFSNKDSDGIRQLRQVLEVFCLHNPTIGYCQGMNFIVAVALLLLEPEDAFWLLISITECHLTNYYDAGLIGAQVDQYVLKELIEQKAPDIHQHFETNEVEITSLTLNWFMAIFIDSVPFETLLRIWDCFLLEGGKVLFRFALAILIINRENILTRTDTISMMKQIKDSTKNLIDVESLFKIAFEDLQPFCHRKDIAVKQAYWTKMLMEKVVKRQLARDGLPKRDYIFQEINQTSTTLDCSVVLSEKIVWIAFGSQYALHLHEINVERGIMIDLDLNYNSRAFCMACVNSELVLLGTLCGTLLGLSIDERRILWATQLRSCLLCMTSLNKNNFSRVYCGLSNGNLAIVQLYNSSEPEEAFCITVDKSAITAVVYRNEKLWCLSSNKMTIVNEKTLDILTTIDLTYENVDSTSIVYYDDDDDEHIWILLRSTNNILQAWNQTDRKLHGYVCLDNLFDKIGKTDEQIALMKESNDGIDDYSNHVNEHIRITSFLIHNQQIWIGTSTGILFVYNFVLQKKILTKSSVSQRSFSITHPLPELIFKRKQMRSRSDSAVVDLVHSSDEGWSDEYGSNRHLYRIAFSSIASSRRRNRRSSTATYPILENSIAKDLDSGDTSTTLTSIKSHSSSPAVISTDEYLNSNRKIHLPLTNSKPSKALEASASFSFNLLFKAKIADTPVKCICKTKSNDRAVILTCSGKLGDDEVACRWKQIPDCNQWTNDVIVEINPDTMIPIRPSYARQQYLRAQRDRSMSVSSTNSKS